VTFDREEVDPPSRYDTGPMLPDPKTKE